MLHKKLTGLLSQVYGVEFVAVVDVCRAEVCVSVHVCMCVYVCACNWKATEDGGEKNQYQTCSDNYSREVLQISPSLT